MFYYILRHSCNPSLLLEEITSSDQCGNFCTTSVLLLVVYSMYNTHMSDDNVYACIPNVCFIKLPAHAAASKRHPTCPYSPRGPSISEDQK